MIDKSFQPLKPPISVHNNDAPNSQSIDIKAKFTLCPSQFFHCKGQGSSSLSENGNKAIQLKIQKRTWLIRNSQGDEISVPGGRHIQSGAAVLWGLTFVLRRLLVSSL